MEVWVRSQDKNRFTQAHNFSYDYEVNKHIVNCNGYPYGIYNSKERCLEIIDEIQSLFGYALLGSVSADGSVKNEYRQRDTAVYEMPKE